MARPTRSLSLPALAVAACLSACGGGTPARPPLVLLVSIDTLRADRLGAYGSERDLTPNLDGLAAESQVFEAAYAPSSFTVPSVSSFLTGRYPTQNAVFTNEHKLPEGATTLAAELGRVGYRTGAVVSNWVLRRGTGLNRGFERYDDEMRQREAIRASFRERVAPDTTDDALALLDELTAGNEPAFLWVHFQDPHGPYTPPAELLAPLLERERDRPGGELRLPFGSDHRGLDGIPNYQRLGDHDEVAYYVAAYDAEVRYADGEIGRLLDGVRARGLWDEAVVVFVADHGEGLGEGDYWFAHGEYLSDPLVRVPFFLRAPGRPPGRRSHVTALVDLLPTVLPLCGVRAPQDLPGRDVLAPGASGQDSPVYLATLGASKLPRFGVVSDGYKYVATYDGERRLTEEVLYRLGDEQTNLAATEPATLDRLRAELASQAERLRPRVSESRQELTAEERRAMGALGYGE